MCVPDQRSNTGYREQPVTFRSPEPMFLSRDPT